MGTLRVVNILCFLLLLLLVLSTVTCLGFTVLTHLLRVLRAEDHSCKVATVCCKMQGASHVLDFADGETCAVQLPDSDRLDSGKHLSHLLTHEDGTSHAGFVQIGICVLYERSVSDHRLLSYDKGSAGSRCWNLLVQRAA
jgi:hypothetical protein